MRLWWRDNVSHVDHLELSPNYGFHVMNFDLNIVAPNGAALGPSWAKGASNFHGSCNLLCHGQDHNNVGY